jgi:hypothetical protein
MSHPWGGQRSNPTLCPTQFVNPYHAPHQHILESASRLLPIPLRYLIFMVAKCKDNISAMDDWAIARFIE